MFHLIQSAMYNEFGFRRLVDAVKTLNLQYTIFELKPFDCIITPLEGELPGPEVPVMLWGMTTIERALKHYGWKPGIFKNDNFDMRVLAEKYGELMLNSDGKFYRLGDVPDYEGTIFIRPVHDTKSFTGQLVDDFEFDKWKASLADMKQEFATVDLNTIVMIAGIKLRIDEARFYVVNGKVEAGSTYRVSGRGLYKSIDTDNPLFLSMRDYAQHVVDIWSPCEAFVIDIARVEYGDGFDKFRVIEINCLNSSGFYDCNITAVMKALENHD